MKPVLSKTLSTRGSGHKHLHSMRLLSAFATGLLMSSGVQAAGQVSSVSVSEQPATPFSYRAGGADYDWGRGDNQLIEAFSADGKNYSFALTANEVLVQRDDIPDVATGEPCGIFVEELAHSESTHTLAADYPSDGTAAGNCDLASLLDSRIVNRGLVDAFSNTSPDAKNIERLDYLFYFGVLAPLSADELTMAGHIVAEKSGNNPVKIAAVLSIDAFGQPDQYGPLVLVSAAGCIDPAICYGSTNLVHNYSFLQNEFNAPQSFPVETERSTEALNVAFVSAADLGLAPGQRYYGVSIFADDVDADVHDLVDTRTFPDDTSDDFIVLGDDADIYGGLTGYYLADELDVISGAVFLDVDLDGVMDPDEAGISDISVALYNDVNGNGIFDNGVDTQIGDTLVSNLDGTFVFPGLAEGDYLVVLDESDPQIPAGLVVATGTNPQPTSIAGIDSDPVSFAFVSESGTGSGSGNDGGNGTGDGDTGGDGTGDGAGDGDAGGDGTGDDTGEGDTGGDGDGTGAGTGDGDTGGDGTGDGTGDGDGGTGGDGTGDGAGDGDAGGDGTGDGAGDGGTGGDGTGDGAGDGGTGGDGTGDGAGDGAGDGDTGGDGTGNGDGDPLADDATAANSDSFEVNQGQSITFDVLENDFDGAGGGLTLLSVSESPNATISIVEVDGELQVLYVPNPGYYSQPDQPDTFTYTMQDADGTQRTGNVEVNVVRFSDLNNNLVNDFIECNCTDLYLETGVDGTGVGSLSRFMLFALALWIMIMRVPALLGGATRIPNRRGSK